MRRALVNVLGDLQHRPADCLQLEEVLCRAALELQDDVLCDAGLSLIYFGTKI